ncbi:tail fiber assembly protein [Pantoea brenneri]|uniref:tail fiber assembly protein n=1 Tax=Pantoea brenneri TaxID=472694 RepID=UPI00210A256D|nr:tail fiber assembly protein [Pantoea brenneri]MCQ5469344.1 tail fiber assembly protein [Pantoea brenneri]
MAKVTLDKNGLAKSAGTLTIYNFDAVSGEFTGSSDEFLAQGVGLPANTCITAPLATETGRVALYRDGSWLNVADHRGETVYSVTDGAAVLIDEPGDYPAGTTPLKPVTAWDKWDGEKWVTDPEEEKAATVKEAKERQTALISEANSITQAWQTQLRLDMLTASDKASLIEWMKYVQSVQAVNVQEAPAITWPLKPQ